MSARKITQQERCELALLVDIETGERDGRGRFVPGPGSVEDCVLRCLRAAQRRVAVVPFNPDIVSTVAELKKLQPGLVFNLTEWVDGDRRLDAAVAGLLDILGLRYTGTGPDGLRRARDKQLSKQMVAALGIRVPRQYAVGRAAARERLPYPVFIKPRFGDGSDGIATGALVRNEAQLARRLRILRAGASGALLCEEYVSGRDLFVAVLGNQPRVLPPLELVVGKKGAGAPQFATGRVKTSGSYRTRWHIRYREAKLTGREQARITDASRRIFRELGLRDYARIDYRLTADGEPVFLEANPNPDLSPHTFGRNRCFAGVSYTELVATIVKAALARKG